MLTHAWEYLELSEKFSSCILSIIESVEDVDHAGNGE